MRLIRILPAFALVGAALILAAPTAGSAATLPTPTRIVLFTGGGNATPVGPATQPAAAGPCPPRLRGSPPRTTARS